jgi:adenosine deaminase
MKKLRSTIVLLFKRLPPDRVFKALAGDKIVKNYVAHDIFKDERFQQSLLEMFPYYSHDEISNVWGRANEVWGKNTSYGGNNGPREGVASVFRLLKTYTNSVLVLEKNRPVVTYNQLLNWRDLTLQLGEDLLTCSFVASKDIENCHQRTFFAWSPILGTNNIRLRNLLSNGLAENHFHLTGSSPYFEISWVALMNRIKERKNEFEELKKKNHLDPEIQYNNSNSSDIYILTIKACYIRLLLFHKLRENESFSEKEKSIFSDKKIAELLSNTSNLNDSKFLLSYIADFQTIIDSSRYIFGLDLGTSKNVTKPDYAITKNMGIYQYDVNLLLCGERKFLYDCFKSIELNDDIIGKYQDLFYAYLIIKEQLRKELIQVNKNVGFNNFQLYQDRKSYFLNKREIYQQKMGEMAVNSTIKNQHLKYVEARMKPKSSTKELMNLIEQCDSNCHPQKSSNAFDRHLRLKERKVCSNCMLQEECIEEGNPSKIKSDISICNRFRDKNEKIYYVLHFTKDKDKSSKNELVNELQSRDHKKRKEVKKETMAIDGLLCSQNDLNRRVVGIDAASSEFNNRPEVFAQAFRFLKGKRDKGQYDHLKENVERPLIRATFHAGEDFYDIVDGLRAIDEAVKFLNLTEGDRIGHALALGIDVREFYKSKHKCLILPKQWHLDNICWLLSRINKYKLHEFSSDYQSLRWQFQTLFKEVYDIKKECKKSYKELFNLTNPEMYYEAWRLRGDDPFLYNANGGLKLNQNLTYWQKSGLNNIYPDKGCKRDSEDIVNRLYFEYHFNQKVKEEGKKIIRFEIKKEYIELVDAVQKCFQKEIQAKHLAIETNPSSNVQIGTFKRYDMHPLVNFYNLGLETNPEKIKSCPQLFVSINTDDQGVFNTYLENEYALMALALEKMEDEDGNKIYNPTMIYDWLDRIRAMGMEMRFGKE